MDSALKKRFAAVKLLASDVDGVLTDGGLYVDERGNHNRRFNVRDGMGVVLLQDVRVQFALISGADSESTRSRARALGVTEVHLGISDKAACLLELAARLGLAPDSVAFVGDDVNDLPALEAAGLSIAPADAVAKVREQAEIITGAAGGGGCIREICDLIIAAKAKPQKL